MRLYNLIRVIPAAVLGAAVGSVCPAATPSWIFGVHDPGGYTKIEQAGKRGWLVVTVEIGHDPNNTSGDNFSFYANRGHGVIVRLNNGYGSNGTLPYQSQYANFAARCANYVAATQGADIFIIGNETNLPREWPGNIGGNPSTGEPITVARYLECYNLCYNAIKAKRPSAQVCPSPSGTWAPPYPAQGIEGFDQYWLNILNGLGASKVDALIIHAYTHGCDPALVTSEVKMQPPYAHIYYNFRVYRNYMSIIPSSMRTKPVYLTECDQNIECADPPPEPRNTWNNVNNGWVKEIYREINNWNANTANQKIRCVALFRWDNVSEGEWSFCFSTRANVVQDWLEAMANDYRWDTNLYGTFSGYVRDTSAQPIVGATVVTSPGGYSAVTGSGGAYTINSVEPGTYNLTASRTGYASLTQYNKSVSGGQTVTVNFALAPVPVLNIVSATSPESIVARGQTGVPVSVTLQNTGSEDLQVDQAYPTFRQGAADVSGFYTAIPGPANGKIIPRGGSLTLDFAVTAHPDAPSGATVLDAYATAWPNTIPNGSFEEGGSAIPPTHWFNWSNAPTQGVSWSYDTAQKALDSRSYRLNLSLSPNNVYVTANTGDGPDLLPVLPSTQYYNSIKKRATVSAGTPQMMLVFAEYDASRTQIGYDKWFYFAASSDWQEVGTTYTTSSNAAYARVWTGMKAVGTTTASLWVDDAQLRPVGFHYTDTTAQTTGAWTVAVPCDTIAGAKALQDLTFVRLTDKKVTARFAGSFYIEDDDRSSGILIDGETSAAIGSRVTVSGTLVTGSAERLVVADQIVLVAPAP